MEKRKHVGFKVKSLNNQIRRMMDKSANEDNPAHLTGMQYAMLGYICRHSAESDVYQRDLERHFEIRRPTATGILQMMEGNGLVVRTPAAQDARMKRITLTEKGLEEERRSRDRIERMETELVRGISLEDLEVFDRVMAQMSENLKRVAP